MKNLNYVSFLFCCMILSIVISSCSKEKFTESEPAEIEVGINAISSQSDLMSFGSIETFYEHYQKMDALYDKSNKEYRAAIEAQMLNSVYKKLGNDVFTDPKERYQPWLGDPVMMGIVNEYLEFQIGEVLLTYVSDKYILVAKSDNLIARDKIRNLDKNNNFDITAIPEDTYLVPSDELETLLGPWGSMDYQPPVVSEYRSGSCVQTGTTIWDWKEDNYGEAISYRTRAYVTWSSLKEETKIYAYKYSGNSWSNQNTSSLYAKIDATRRNRGSCSHYNDEDEVNTCNNCRDEYARVNTAKRRRHNSLDVYGSVDKTYQQNNWYNSISASHYVPF